ncbi:MAG: sodium:proton antiporter [Planctomycetota bacterium]
MHSTHGGSDARAQNRLTQRLVRAFVVVATLAIALLLVIAPHAAPDAPVPELPSAWWLGVAPFALLLGAIAAFPLIPALSHWWHSNLNRYLVSIVVSILALAFLGAARGAEGVGTALHHAIPGEYVPFMSLLFALYVIAGGLRIGTPFDGKPHENLSILLVGALVASFIGTTGAAMVLIRPLLESIRRRKYRAHSVVFFIFIVCNCGGCLLPIGDPPLFMGYLRGIPFFWTLGLWKEWALVNGLLLIAYFAIDAALFRKERREIQAADDHRTFFVQGVANIPLLAAAIAAVAVLVPGKTVPGTDLVAPNFLREGVLLALAGASWALTARKVRTDNRFEFGAIIEVAAIFLGIFISMQMPLEVLKAAGPSLGVESPIAFYWITGALSSFLDNAPTYVVFLEIAKTLPFAESETYVALASGQVREDLLVAISLGAVFMGANTYIGNGPNFMVKAIAENEGVAMPSFFGYMAWSVGILIPLLALAEIFFP